MGLDPTRCALSRRFGSTFVATASLFVRTSTGAPLSQPQRCQPHGGGGSEHAQGSACGIRGAAAIDLRLDPTRCALLRRFGSIFVATARFRPSKDRSTTQPATVLSATWWRRFWARPGVRVRHSGRSSHRLGAGSDVVRALAARRSAESCVFWRAADESMASEPPQGVCSSPRSAAARPIYA